MIPKNIIRKSVACTLLRRSYEWELQGIHLWSTLIDFVTVHDRKNPKKCSAPKTISVRTWQKTERDGLTLGYNTYINTKGGATNKSTSINVYTNINTTSLNEVVCVLQNPSNWGGSSGSTSFKPLWMSQTPTEYHFQMYMPQPLEPELICNENLIALGNNHTDMGITGFWSPCQEYRNGIFLWSTLWRYRNPSTPSLVFAFVIQTPKLLLTVREDTHTQTSVLPSAVRADTLTVVVHTSVLLPTVRAVRDHTRPFCHRRAREVLLSCLLLPVWIRMSLFPFWLCLWFRFARETATCRSTTETSDIIWRSRRFSSLSGLWWPRLVSLIVVHSVVVLHEVRWHEQPSPSSSQTSPFFVRASIIFWSAIDTSDWMSRHIISSFPDAPVAPISLPSTRTPTTLSIRQHTSAYVSFVVGHVGIILVGMKKHSGWARHHFPQEITQWCLQFLFPSFPVTSP